MAGAHALVQPSGLARTIQCPASLVMQRKHPGYGDDSAALEGEAAHWVAQHALAGDWAPVGSAAPNGVTITEEMHEGAWEVLDTIAADLQPYDMGLGDVAVEVPVDIPRVHAECWGTPDYRCWVPANRTPNGRSRLYVWDYKFGHSPVEAFENPQLVAYASGALSATKVSDLDVDVTLVIIQPRTYHRAASAPSWSTTAVNLRALVNLASNAAHEALGDNPEAHTGPECLNCAARHACTLYQSTAYMAIDLAGAPQPLELPPDALGLELRLLTQAAERLRGRITGLQEQALAVDPGNDEIGRAHV